MRRLLTLAVTAGLAATTAMASDVRSAIETPDAKKIIEKDLLGPAKQFTMPKGCISEDPDAIARGAFIFNNLNGKKAKADAPKGLTKKLADGSPKQYGNCVACHNIENAKGGGNIGPDLTDYHEIYVASKARSPEWVYQKIADARIDNKDTTMTINLTTGLFTEQEICDIASYVISKK
jgi:L-cysteine S-thiosulfotransferase